MNVLDKKIVQQLQEQFFEECSDLFSAVENSLLEIEKSGGDDDRKTLLRSLHSIKGSSRAVGFEALAVFAHQLETQISNSQNKLDFSFMFQALDLMVEYVKLLKQNQIKEADQILGRVLKVKAKS